MTTEKQRTAARTNIRKAQAAWASMSSRQHAMAQPEGRARKRPGTGGEGNYYHVEVRRSKDFATFRTQDVGDPGHIQRVAGKRGSGSWDTVKWLISKDDAHMEHKHLVPDSREAKEVLSKLGSPPVHLKGDIFEAKPRSNVPERDKPTPAQKRARSENIKKAQAARRG
ncbi:MAG: hypothetical protein M0Z73_08425 [Betaproteobacteria bacterium]|nr:hypothetical protein [Betaproteobacteria bacterium]